MTQLAGYGRLGKDPVRRTTKDGKLMVTASLAVGAVLASVDIAAFSSHGPTSRGPTTLLGASPSLPSLLKRYREPRNPPTGTVLDLARGEIQRIPVARGCCERPLFANAAGATTQETSTDI